MSGIDPVGGPGWSGQPGFVEQVSTPPVFPVVVAPGAAALDLSWDLLAAARGYTVYCGLAPNRLIPVGETQDAGFSIANLDPGRTYFVQVIAWLSSDRAVASVSEDSGGNLVATQLLAFVPQSGPARSLLWDPATVSGEVVLSGDLLLATSVRPFNPDGQNFDNSGDTTAPDVSGLLVYAEVEIFPPYQHRDFSAEQSLVGISPGPESQAFAEFRAGVNWFLNAAGSDGASFDQDTGLACDGAVTLFGFLVDMINARYYLHINGLWYDTATLAFKSSYQETTPFAFVPGTGFPFLYWAEFNDAA